MRFQPGFVSTDDICTGKNGLNLALVIFTLFYSVELQSCALGNYFQRALHIVQKADCLSVFTLHR